MSSHLVPFNFEYDDKFSVITKFKKLVGPMRYSTSLPVNEIQSYPITVRIVNTSSTAAYIKQVLSSGYFDKQDQNSAKTHSPNKFLLPYFVSCLVS